ncbi:MAG: glycosyltransferase family A protein [Bryobacteraceae bacterium]
MMLWLWIGVGPALVAAAWSLRGERKRALWVTGQLGASPVDPLPQASVIVPLGGGTETAEDIRRGLEAIAALDYPDCEVIVAALNASAIPPRALPDRAKVVLGQAGPLAGVEGARRGSQVLAFANPDAIPGKQWLRALVVALQQNGADAATGYRWFLPARPAFWALLRSVCDGIIADAFGAGPSRLVYPGSMAVWRHALKGSAATPEALRRGNVRIVYAPGAAVVCTSGISGPEFFTWIRRRASQIRRDDPALWWRLLVLNGASCAGMAASVTASLLGSRLAEWALVALLGLTILKGANRATLAKASLPEFRAWFDRHSWVHAFWLPLASWAWVYGLIGSLTKRKYNR